MNFSDELVAVTQAAIDSAAAKALAERNEEQERLSAITEARIAEYADVTKIRRLAAEAATKGRNYFSISVFSYSDDTPHYFDPVCKAVKKIAVELGLEFEPTITSLDSSGSDPLFDHKTYYGSITLSWKVA